MIDLTIWMNMPSFYQDDLFRALVATGEVDLRVVFARGLAEERKRLGWGSELGDYPYQWLPPGRRGIAEVVRTARAHRDRVHIINGIWAEPAFAVAFVALSRSGSPFAVYTEAPEPSLRRGPARRLLRYSLGRWVARRASGIFAISHFAEEYYRGLGFREETIYPFGYFRSHAVGSARPEPVGGDGMCEVLFVGQLTHRKGVDLLIEALRPLVATVPGLRLSLIGDGPDRSGLRTLAEEAGLGDHVRFEGVLPHRRILERLETADLLVLPSRWDGWGLVVNEALAAGVPVISSDRCGASDLIREGANGYVFRGGDAADLRRKLSQFLGAGDRRGAMREEARRTGRAVSAESAATYLVECIKTMSGPKPKPRPPWHRPGPGGG